MPCHDAGNYAFLLNIVFDFLPDRPCVFPCVYPLTFKLKVCVKFDGIFLIVPAADLMSGSEI